MRVFNIPFPLKMGALSAEPSYTRVIYTVPVVVVRVKYMDAEFVATVDVARNSNSTPPLVKILFETIS